MGDKTLRILFLGAKGVGKSSLINLILHQKFVEPKETVVGSLLFPPKVKLYCERGVKNVELLDTNGDEYYEDFSTSLITPDVNGVFCVCEVTNNDSQRKALGWTRKVINNFPRIRCAILINKYEEKKNAKLLDLLIQTSEEAKKVPIFKVSAKEPQKFPIEHALKLLTVDDFHPLVKPKNKLFKFSPTRKETILHFCPFCKERIPKLNLFIVKEELKVLIRCECKDYYCDIMRWDFYENFTKDVPFQKGVCQGNESHQEMHFLANSFCITCQKWLCNECLQIHDSNDKRNHKISSCKFTLRDTCRKHNEPLYYCEICRKYECTECGQDNDRGLQDVVDGTFYDEITKIKNIIKDRLPKNESVMNIKLANAITSLQEDLVNNSLYDIQIEKNFWNNFNCYKNFPHNLNDSDRNLNFNKEIYNIDLNVSFKLKPKIQAQLYEKNEKIYPIDILEYNNSNNSNQLMVVLSNKIEILQKNNLTILQTASEQLKINNVIKESTITAFCSLSNGSYALATSSRNNYILYVITSKGVFDADNHKDEISCLCEAYDSEKRSEAILSGSFDGSVRVWSLRLECYGYLSAYFCNVNCISDLGEGMVAVLSDGKGIVIWKLKYKEGPIDSLPLAPTDSSPIKAVVYKKTEEIKMLICAHGEGLVTVWEKEKGKIDLDAKFMAHQGFIYSMCVFRKTKLCTGGEDNYIKVWDLSFYALLEEYKIDGPVTVLRPLKDGTLLAGTGDNYYYQFEFN